MTISPTQIIDAATLAGSVRRLSYGIAARQAVDRELDALLARQFNLLDWMIDGRREKGEVLLSELVAMLLTADGPHGQGVSFQEAFVSACHDATKERSPSPGAGPFRVRTERSIRGPYATLAGRLDIELERYGSSGELELIVIENKPFAPDGLNQLARYQTWLEERAGKRTLLVHLRGASNPPGAYSMGPNQQEALRAEGRLLTIDYRWLASQWLDPCRTRCRAPRVANLLSDFIAWIEREFPEERMR